MKIDFDSKKNKANIKKHVLDFNDAHLFDWENAEEFSDNRKRYGEPRIIAVGYFFDRLTVLVYTTRGDKRRVISWRKANQREVKSYG